MPKISCQGKVEVVKHFPQELDSERNGEQSRVKGAPMSPCWDVGNIVMRRGLQFLDKVQKKVWVRGALFCSGGQQFFFVVAMDALAHVIFLSKWSIVACVPNLSQNKAAQNVKLRILLKLRT